MCRSLGLEEGEEVVLSEGLRLGDGLVDGEREGPVFD